MNRPRAVVPDVVRYGLWVYVVLMDNEIEAVYASVVMANRHAIRLSQANNVPKDGNNENGNVYRNLSHLIIIKCYHVRDMKQWGYFPKEVYIRESSRKED